jgi:siroheme synthase (precorrin-2 oxidase/ferrochelatase)
MNYMTLWIGVIGDRMQKFSKLSKEQKELYIESLTDLKELNRAFHDYAIPDQKLWRNISWLIEDTFIWLRYRFSRKKGQNAMYPFIKRARKLTKKLAEAPY